MNAVAKRILTGLTLGGLIVAALAWAPLGVFAPVCAALWALASAETVLLLGPKWRGETFRAAAVAAFFIALLGVLFTVLPILARDYGRGMLFYVIAIVKFSDVGGFAFGTFSAKRFKGGSHKLCPSVSPGKSWEGLLGSVVFSCAVSSASIPLTHFGCGKALAFGVTAALVGTAGDLVESKLKRWVGVKDSSSMRLTNGLGGFLDMFDSLLFAPALLLPFI